MTSRFRFVIDSSVLIDIDNGNVIDEFCQLPYEIITTDLICEELEKKNALGSRLVAKGIIITELQGHLTAMIPELRVTYRGTSAADISCFILAEDTRMVLLTGDGDLRKAAKLKGMPCHGTLYVLDQMVEVHKVISPLRGASSLNRIQECGARLPGDRCAERFSKWSAGAMLKKV